MQVSKMVKEYRHNNQALFLDEETNTYRLWSYSTLVLEVVNGKIELNMHGQISTTTSKHITQCLSFLRTVTHHNF